MINVLALVLILLFIMLPTLISVTRNTVETSLRVFLLNFMLLVISIIVPYSESLIDGISNILLVWSYLIMLSYIPDESDPKDLRNVVRYV
ncbi:hypothetical protein RaK2_00263 [Klebsiella phage vB_KleM_RaK2]|uniref:Uncharacterized protein n=1 Tax=Klebsiella phage vB_KleM_RaK2 TaxID=1147094 RepID=H6X470_9CAUD|nr:hypothetical protein F403_gp272 [Klebsiella phage vB_KleM_RaK2]AFA44536.1 hypothetical protein RaK2_00263 [Klebsiella phage vB_KleM_RaK2]